MTNFIFDGEVLKSYSGLGLTNKTVNFQNINGYYETSQFELKKLCILYNQNEKLIISSDYTNYEIFKSLIEKQKKLIPPVKNKIKIGTPQVLGGMMVIIGLMLLVTIIKKNSFIKENIQETEVESFIGTIAHPIQIKNMVVQKKSQLSRILIRLDQFPNNIFHISGLSLKATQVPEIFDNVKPKDSVVVFVYKDEFELKINNKKRISFSEKLFSNQEIAVIGLGKANMKYYILHYETINDILDKKKRK